MNTPRYSNPQRYARSDTFDLKFSCHRSLVGSNLFIYSVTLKIDNGVKFWCEFWHEQPSEALMAQRCSQFGQFSMRPYLAGQVTDESTSDCVLALYYNYCRSASIDPTALLARTYPGWETAEEWTDSAWRSLLVSAAWHRTTIPAQWAVDGVIGLLLSLTTQGRRALAETLTQEILLRRPGSNTGASS
jgi:hypothetical protein